MTMYKRIDVDTSTIELWSRAAKRRACIIRRLPENLVQANWLECALRQQQSSACVFGRIVFLSWQETPTRRPFISMQQLSQECSHCHSGPLPWKALGCYLDIYSRLSHLCLPRWLVTASSVGTISKITQKTIQELEGVKLTVADLPFWIAHWWKFAVW